VTGAAKAVPLFFMSEILKTADEVASFICGRLKNQPLTLFAGAGVGVQAELPDWKAYLENLIAFTAEYEPESAELMRKRVGSDHYPEAAHYYMTCLAIPDGIKAMRLVDPFKKYNAVKLRPLVRLPFTSIVTTNYDFSLHDAWAATYQKAPHSFESDEASLKAAVFDSEFHIARIHGRVDLPASIIIEVDDYKKLSTSQGYIDFLSQVFLHRTCLFIGFSFIDPAIRGVLQIVRMKFGAYPRNHYALLPSGAEKLRDELARVNIETSFYDSANGHNALWKGIELAATRCGRVSDPSGDSNPIIPSETTKQLIALCYAQYKVQSEATPLKKLVVQGIVLAAVEEGSRDSLQIIRILRKYLPLSEEEAESLLSDVLPELIHKGWLSDQHGITKIERHGPPEELPLDSLADSLAARLFVREKYQLPAKDKQALSRILEDIIVFRGWQLGASFSTSRNESEVNFLPTITRAVRKHLPSAWQDRQSQIADACLDMLRKPEPREEQILADLGRIAFGVELVMQTGRSALYALSLPEQIYLDSNVLLPIIVEGHPYRATYLDAINKLHAASASVGTSPRIIVTDVILDEVISHRARAVELVKDLGLEEKDRLQRHIIFFGAENVNVFIGAYSSRVATQGELAFGDFLHKVAPYTTIGEAEQFLKHLNIEIAYAKPEDTNQSATYDNMRYELQKGYDRLMVRPGIYEKAQVLIKHEAAQLALLRIGILKGKRCYFVTADRKLRSIISAPGFESIRDAVISHLGLIQLIDLLIGIEIEPGSLSRIFWSVKAVNEQAILKNYLLDLALQHYDAALLLNMGRILDDTAHAAAKEAKLEKVTLVPSEVSDKETRKTVRFLDRVSANFFKNMAEEMEKQKRK
jgi:hypothetical protein